ncbi:DNA repair protein RecN [Pikeienuella piscinae]|uniref:DNA repair protein RecN n=1 Tax=Pikeienuella piscinae TaxID=2748098 RepID=A0A7M3T6M7_9RHOB|nr:DNA repair protein RecN [Pikeienuella piscinae]QIE57658.1 DNA repair protein RecN [Pikeienuella piscinae]
MLESLEIRDVILIEMLTIGFSPGLNVLTGETGAGKSILLDALGFALGRVEARGLVRAGAKEGSVAATLRPGPDHPVRSVLAEAGLAPMEDTLILRRVAAASGPSRAYLNDQRVSAETLRAIGEALVEVHGQHDDRGLLNARGHRALLDVFARAEPELAACRAAHRVLRNSREALAATEAQVEAAARDRDFLEHSVAELSAFAPEQGEDDTLDARRRAMQAAARIGEEVQRAAALLGPEGAEGAALDAMRRLSGAAVHADGRLDPPIDALDRAIEALAGAAAGVEAALEEMAFDPMELERVEERLFALRALARKHDCAPDDLATLAATMESQLSALAQREEETESLRRAAAAAEAAHLHAVAALGAKRREAAIRLDKAVAAELPALKMERAEFSTRISAAEPGPEGGDQVAFEIAANPGAPAGPLGKVASGGELSRLLLALKVALTAEGSTGVMIFDEIDRGVGGATADAVGRRLARLAAGAQILVVTHSPQVAAFGRAQFRIEKTASGDQTRTSVTRLSDDERRDEIARMLSGDEITEAARGAAAALLSAAAG